MVSTHFSPSHSSRESLTSTLSKSQPEQKCRPLPLEHDNHRNEDLKCSGTDGVCSHFTAAIRGEDMQGQLLVLSLPNGSYQPPYLMENTWWDRALFLSGFSRRTIVAPWNKPLTSPCPHLQTTNDRGCASDNHIHPVDQIQKRLSNVSIWLNKINHDLSW